MKSKVLLISFLFAGWWGAAFSQQVKNVIFMIGDGMGFNQVYAALTANGGKLTMTGFPYTGVQTTFSADQYVTDSAASGTALATGKKTRNHMVGMTPDSTAVESVMSRARKGGKSTGVVVTSSLLDATPAAYYAHQPERSMKPQIAADLLNSDIDIAMGGGKDVLAVPAENGSVLDRLAGKGYQVVYTLEDIQALNSGKVVAVLGDDGVPSVMQGRGNYLPEAVATSIRLLNQDPEGFFLMVEGSQIDWGAHENNLEYMVSETLDFDRAVEVALNFAREDGHTLVVVTADHETGGVALDRGNMERKEAKVNFTSHGHTGTFVPVFAYGPGGEWFTGVIDNTSHKNKLLELMGL